jgi:polar amino acid transport system substrate-binding protein
MRVWLKTLVFVLGLSHWLVPSSQAQDTLTFSMAQNAAPVALAVRIVESAYDQLGISITKLPMARSRNILTASSNEVDGIIAGPKLFDQEFPFLTRIDVPILQIDIRIFSCNPDLLDANSVKQKRWGRINGARLLSKYTEGYDDVWLGDTFQELFGMLKLDRLDAVVGPQIALDIYSKREDRGCIEAVGGSLGQVDFFHYLHSKNGHLVPNVTRVLRDMLDTGKIKEITESFLRLKCEETPYAG